MLDILLALERSQSKLNLSITVRVFLLSCVMSMKTTNFSRKRGKLLERRIFETSELVRSWFNGVKAGIFSAAL